jgi:2'-5' RNA ligase
LGEVDRPSEVVDVVHQALDDVAPGTIEAVLGPATRWFPGRTVLHVPVAGLETIADPVRRYTARWAADRGQDFSGHITLARVRGRDHGPAQLAGIPLSGHFTVADLAVFASTLRPGGATYEVVERISIAHGQPGV